MHESRRQHGHLRQPREAALGGVDAELLAPPLPCGRQAHEIRHRRAGDHYAGPRRRQTEQLFQPVQRLALHLDADRGQDPGVGHRIERRREQVGPERGRRVATDDEVVTARPGGVRPGQLTEPQQLFDGCLGAAAGLRQRAPQYGKRRGGILLQGRPIVGTEQHGGDCRAELIDEPGYLFAKRGTEVGIGHAIISGALISVAF